MGVDDTRECQRCGATTTVKEEEKTPHSSQRAMRVCDDDECIWCVKISGGTRA